MGCHEASHFCDGNDDICVNDFCSNLDSISQYGVVPGSYEITDRVVLTLTDDEYWMSWTGFSNEDLTIDTQSAACAITFGSAEFGG